jgi:hypothetical protein
LARAAIALALALLGILPGEHQQPSTPSGTITARFHHVHYLVGDPSAAMSEAVRITEGVRVIVQGIGVGVRAGREFILFDRTFEASPGTSRAASASDAYRAALAQLQSAGFAVDPPAPDGSRAINALHAPGLDHLGFAVDDVRAAAAQLRASGARMLTTRDDAVLVEMAGGLRIEILRDTDREERFWCPMHPDVRSADGGKCPLCAMDLVAIPPPRIGEYGLDVSAERNAGDGTIRALRFGVREPGSNTPVGELQVVHERTFHLFIVSRDLEFFDHVHPERLPDGRYELRRALPRGEYMLIADFLPLGGTSQMVQRAVISGRPSTNPPREPVFADAAVRTVTKDGVTVRLDAEAPRAGREVLLTFRLADAQTGHAVTDLQAYLGAPAHLLIVRGDLSDAVHAHPEEVATTGPAVSFHPVLPAEGHYKLWLQVQRGGRVITVPFVLRTER